MRGSKNKRTEMKKIIVILTALLSPLLMLAQHHVTIQGRVAKLNNATKIYLLYPDTSGMIFKIIDSAAVRNHQFSFTLKDNIPEKVLLTIRHKKSTALPANKSDQLPVYLLSSGPVIQLQLNTGYIKDAVVVGSKNNSLYASYLEMLKPYDKQSQQLLAKFKAKGPDANKDTAFMKDLINERNRQNETFREAELRYIRANYDSYIALEILQSCFVQGLMEQRLAEAEFDKFSVELKKTKLGRYLSESIMRSKIELRGDGSR